MASARIPALRHLACCPLRSSRSCTQRRWAQVSDVRFLTTTRPARAIVDKYHSKLEERAQKEGLASVDELKSAYAEKIQEERRKNAVDLPAIPQAPTTPVKQPNRDTVPDTSPAPKPEDNVLSGKARASSSEKRPVRSLDEIIDLDKVRDLPEEELSAIWRLRHASSPQSLCAVVPAPTYQTMVDLARTAPQFVLPVPHETQGAEIHFLQWTFDPPSKTSTVLFTHLAEYKARGEFAQPHTTVTHHLDLAGDKGLVLMQGQVVKGRGVAPETAQWLVMCLQKFYGGWDGGKTEVSELQKERAEERKRLLGWFAKGDSNFTIEKLLDEAERMG